LGPLGVFISGRHFSADFGGRMENKTIPRYGKTLYIATAAMIAALYVILTFLLFKFASGTIQFRLSECLTVLPILTPAAIPGLTIGCLLFNLFNPESLGPVDIVFGSLATLMAAVSTRWLSEKLKRIKGPGKDLIALLPPVIINSMIVGTYLTFLLTGTFQVTIVLMNIAYIALSEAVVVYMIGFPILLLLRKAGIDKPRKG
jgi:uncharacterized membrane protein